MRTIRTKIYKFDELTPDAQKKAVELLHDINTDFDWWNSTYDDFQSLAKYFGVDVDLKKTWFTLSYSQGDGSSFTADVDVCKLISCIVNEGWKEYAPKENFSLPKVTRNIERIVKFIERGVISSSVNIHPVNRETGVNILCEFEYDNSRRLERVEFALGELEDLIKYVALELNKFLFRQLRNECEYQSSREAIIETIKANEYEFFKDGKLYDNR